MRRVLLTSVLFLVLVGCSPRQSGTTATVGSSVPTSDASAKPTTTAKSGKKPTTTVAPTNTPGCTEAKSYFHTVDEAKAAVVKKANLDTVAKTLYDQGVAASAAVPILHPDITVLSVYMGTQLGVTPPGSAPATAIGKDEASKSWTNIGKWINANCKGA